MPFANWLKKSSEVLVTRIKPTNSHVRSASYNCSATARVDRYQGYRVTSADSFVELWSGQWENYVSVIVLIFRVTSDSDSRCGVDTRVDGVNRAKRVDVNLEIGQRLVGARLEGNRIASCINVPCVDGCKDGVRVLPGPTTLCIGHDVTFFRDPIGLNIK